jgi:hypothetical protein
VSSINLRESMLREKRCIERIRCYYYLKTYNRNSGEELGSIVDISMKGMQIVSENSFEIDTLYNFKVKLPKGYILGDAFAIDAYARWCKENEEGGTAFYQAGFEFADFERKGVIFLRTLINDFKENDLL